MQEGICSTNQGLLLCCPTNIIKGSVGFVSNDFHLRYKPESWDYATWMGFRFFNRSTLVLKNSPLQRQQLQVKGILLDFWLIAS